MPDTEPAFAYLLAKPESAKWAAAPVVRTGMDIQRDGEADFQPGHAQLFVASLAGGAARVQTRGDADASNLAWTRDGGGL